MAYLTKQELKALGLANCGKNVSISDKASIYNPSKISIGNNVRIDDFCVISAGEGGIFLGNYIHLAVYSSIIGAGKVTFSDFGGLSSRASIYSSNDDYSGEYLAGPTVPSQYLRIKHADVSIGKYVAIGSGSIILPGVIVEDGVVVTALSVVNKNCAAFGVYAGNRRIRERSRHLIELADQIRMDDNK
jgi:galactoside O-acetyltransferase